MYKQAAAGAWCPSPRCSCRSFPPSSAPLQASPLVLHPEHTPSLVQLGKEVKSKDANGTIRAGPMPLSLSDRVPPSTKPTQAHSRAAGRRGRPAPAASGCGCAAGCPATAAGLVAGACCWQRDGCVAALGPWPRASLTSWEAHPGEQITRPTSGRSCSEAGQMCQLTGHGENFLKKKKT